MENYNSVQDTRFHKAHLENFMKRVTVDLVGRSRNHDNSKLYEPEKGMYNIYIPRLSKLEYGSAAYNACLTEMNESVLSNHYEHNDHHPEHFENGINDMNLIQLLEMVCDWMATVAKKYHNEPISPRVAFDINQIRFGYSDELKGILVNTVTYIEELRKI